MSVGTRNAIRGDLRILSKKAAQERSTHGLHQSGGQ